MKKIKERYKNVADLWVDIENLFILIYLGIGAYGMRSLLFRGAPIVSIFYVSCAIVLVMGLTLMHRRASGFCFGKRYASAWGIVAAELYRKGDCKNQIARRLAFITLVVVTALPIFAMGYLLYCCYTKAILNLFVIFLALSIVQFGINKQFRKKFSMDYSKAPEEYK
jgi:hypothetical protein